MLTASSGLILGITFSKMTSFAATKTEKAPKSWLVTNLAI